MGEEKRHEMLQNLFGDQSEEEGEIDSEHESNPNPIRSLLGLRFLAFIWAREARLAAVQRTKGRRRA
uniref:Uncharacterized protein n=1 Tax=Cannabis sativa TaxID=3483 RepID=A0A803QQ40_CANSA